jgi:hypothetical protein
LLIIRSVVASDRIPAAEPVSMQEALLKEILMRRMVSCIAVGSLAFMLAGCDSGVTEGTVPFKETDTKQFDQMKEDMVRNLMSSGKVKASAPKKSQPAPAAEKKPEGSAP